MKKYVLIFAILFIATNSFSQNRECSVSYFHAIIEEGDVKKLQEELMKVIPYFSDKPKFDTLSIIRYCLSDIYSLIYEQIRINNADMLKYLLTVTKYRVDEQGMWDAVNNLIEGNSKNETIKIIKILQENGAIIEGHHLHETMKNGDLETVKLLHEQGINLKGSEANFCHFNIKGVNYGGCRGNPIDYAKETSKSIYNYLHEQGYKTLEELQEEKREEEIRKLKEVKEQAINEIKANKNDLEKCINICVEQFSDYYSIIDERDESEAEIRTLKIHSFGNKATDSDPLYKICVQSLTSKIRKLPLNQIKSESVAHVYFSQNGYHDIKGKVIQNDSKMALLKTEIFDDVFMLQLSGKCKLRQNQLFSGYGKYIGEKVYTTVLGARQSVPNFQLLWCRN